MDLMQLKLPPDKLPIIADALERDIAAGGDTTTTDDLRDIVVWLRYRHSKWTKDRPTSPKR